MPMNRVPTRSKGDADLSRERFRRGEVTADFPAFHVARANYTNSLLEKQQQIDAWSRYALQISLSATPVIDSRGLFAEAS